jgi:Asp-tRNA(Asn)/Glu-tRNA(Gln) amidotransferase A subunit family amidase
MARHMPDISASRRHFLAVFSATGLSSTLMPGVLWGLTQDAAKAGEPKKITKAMIDEAADIAGVDIADEYKEMMLDDLNDYAKGYVEIRKLNLPNSVPPAMQFDPVLPGMKFPPLSKRTAPLTLSRVSIPQFPNAFKAEDIAYYSVRKLAELIRTKRISPSALTEMYLERVDRYDPILHFVITSTADRARAQAKEADREIAAGKYRGPLHGLPWGAKDLLAVKGYLTTWGAAGFEDQRIDEDATVVKRLDAAGAILLGKFSLGALALGDLWFKNRTRNPWKPEQGSSGSSAGSASAVAAGCCAFAIGSETLGSISSPSTRCGTTGLRPTFGRIPRTGAMALCWSMDKLGPICRYAEDTAIILDAIHGADDQDPTARSFAFVWNPALDIRKLRIGYAKADFEKEPEFDQNTKPDQKERTLKNREVQKRFDAASLAVLREKLGINLIEVELPKLPADAMLTNLSAESAAAFDYLTRSGRDKLLTAQTKDDWPNYFRGARFIPAVEYVQAARARTLLMQQMAEVFKRVDVIVAPTGGGKQLVITNLTGHPAVIVPNGFRPADAPAAAPPPGGGGPGTPTSITFIGNLFGEASLIATAKAYQDVTDFHLQTPERILQAAIKG